jgi:hypothetical protein
LAPDFQPLQPLLVRGHHLAREFAEHPQLLGGLPARQHDLHVQVLLHRPGAYPKKHDFPNVHVLVIVQDFSLKYV